MKKAICGIASLASVTVVIFSFWYLVFSPRYFFLNSVMDCMLEVGSDSREAYEFCCDRVKETNTPRGSQ